MVFACKYLSDTSGSLNFFSWYSVFKGQVFRLASACFSLIAYLLQLSDFSLLASSFILLLRHKKLYHISPNFATRQILVSDCLAALSARRDKGYYRHVRCYCQHLFSQIFKIFAIYFYFLAEIWKNPRNTRFFVRFGGMSLCLVCWLKIGTGLFRTHNFSTGRKIRPVEKFNWP